VLIHDGRGEIAAKLKKYIGRMTNNVAEYYGLIAALGLCGIARRSRDSRRERFRAAGQANARAVQGEE